MSFGRRIVAVLALVGAGIVGLYVALGGGRFEPVRSADPCLDRPWRSPAGIQGIFEQVGLSALDGAACDLGVTREDLALTLADQGRLEAFARSRGIDDARLAEILRVGLRRAVLDAQRAGVLEPVTVLLAGEVIDRTDIGGLIDAYRSGRFDWLGAFVP